MNRKISVLIVTLLMCLTAIVIVPDDTVNETTVRMINSSEQLGLDTIFNGLVNTSDLLDGFGSGSYRVYACFRDPDGDVLVCDDDSLMEASYGLTVSSS